MRKRFFFNPVKLWLDGVFLSLHAGFSTERPDNLSIKNHRISVNKNIHVQGFTDKVN